MIVGSVFCRFGRTIESQIWSRCQSRTKVFLRSSYIEKIKQKQFFYILLELETSWTELRLVICSNFCVSCYRRDRVSNLLCPITISVANLTKLSRRTDVTTKLHASLERWKCQIYLAQFFRTWRSLIELFFPIH